ncbi:MAG TPA: HD domain-containing phosphohydrolase [Thermoanaerobaculia bacterium]
MSGWAEPLRPPGSPRGSLLVVDDDVAVRGLVARLLRVTGHSVDEVGSAEEAAIRLASSNPDLILLDMQLPGKSGQQFLEEIRANPRLRLVPVVMITGAATQARKVKAIEAGATDFIAKPFSHVELAARVRSLLELKFATDALEDAERVIVSLAQTIDARDPYTFGHSARVSLYAGLLGERVGLEASPLAVVRRGGLFHDFGKIAIRDRILLKPGKLTKEEYSEIQKHPGKGRDLLQHMKTLNPALEVVQHHHERMDGSGYPDGLAGESIPITARIATIADVFDALTTKRVYREALTREEALEIMQEEVRKGWWDGRLLDEFVGVLKDIPPDDWRLLRLARPDQVPDAEA